MPAQPPSVDPEVLEDLVTVEEARRLFKRAGRPLEIWEGLCLVKEDRALMREEVKRLADLRASGQRAGIGRVIVDRLQTLRQQSGALVVHLRALFPGVPEAPQDPVLQEMILAFIAISPKGREAAQRWTADPGPGAVEAGPKIRAIALSVARYRAELDRAHPPEEEPANAEAEPPPPEPVFEEMEVAQFERPGIPTKGTPDPFGAGPPPPKPPAPPATAAAPASASAPAKTPEPGVPVELPPGVDRDVLDDVRRVEQCRKVFEVTHQQIEVWEVFCLVMLADETKGRMDGLLDLREKGDMNAFTDGALMLFEKLLDMRATYGRFVRKLREYVAELPVGRFGKDTMEMALGFIVASARGRARAQQWMDEPDRHRAEAAGRLEDIISRTINYQTALRSMPPQA